MTATAARPAARPGSGALPLALLAAPAAAGLSGPTLALADAARDLAVPPGSAAWLLTAYGIGMAVGTPLLPALAARSARHGAAGLGGVTGLGGVGGVVRAGAVLVVLGAVLCLLAPNLPAVVAGRILEAAGAAGLNVAAFQIAGRDRSGRTPGLVAIGSAVGGTTGVFAGAALAGALGWRATLLLPLLSLLVLAPTLRLAGPPDRTPAGAVAAPRGALPLDVFGAPGFRIAAGMILALATVNFALLYEAPRRVAALTGWTAVQTGAAASLATLAGALLSWQLIRAAPRLGPRRLRALLAAGSLGSVAAAVLAPWWLVVLAGSGASALVTAGGQGLLTGTATEGLPEARHGTAVGLFNLAFLIGASAGPALAAALT
ncbi:MFS transporter [Streptomyces sp. NPDC012769]|uniref:MFS transporter n=1 Tax=Streptomyces sp. NPDC012769 TaxID=3364848 RepID=UPI0036ABC51D